MKCNIMMMMDSRDGLQNLTNKLKDTQAFLNKNQLGDFLDKLSTVTTTGVYYGLSITYVFGYLLI